MERFDDFLTPSESRNFKKYQIEQFACYMRLEITEYILDTGSTNSKYYDLSQFFDKYKIKDEQQKEGIKTIIFDELCHLQWHLATIFGDTGLIIVASEEAIKNSIWASSFDFKII